jgi:hypothetical protein
VANCRGGRRNVSQVLGPRCMTSFRDGHPIHQIGGLAVSPAMPPSLGRRRKSYSVPDRKTTTARGGAISVSPRRALSKVCPNAGPLCRSRAPRRGVIPGSLVLSPRSICLGRGGFLVPCVSPVAIAHRGAVSSPDTPRRRFSRFCRWADSCGRGLVFQSASLCFSVPTGATISVCFA